MYLRIYITYIKEAKRNFHKKKINKGKEVYSTRNKEEDYVSREKFTLPLKMLAMELGYVISLVVKYLNY